MKVPLMALVEVPGRGSAVLWDFRPRGALLLGAVVLQGIFHRCTQYRFRCRGIAANISQIRRNWFMFVAPL